MRRRQFLRSAAASGLALSVSGAAGAARADTALSPGYQAVVSVDGVNVRGGPGPDQPVVASLDSDTYVDLLGASADGMWWRVAAGHTVGYVNAALLTATSRRVNGDVFDLDLPISYSRQLTDIWCDPADIEMWMHYRVGDSGSAHAAVQSAIWDWETTHNAGFSVDQWDCSPYAVASAAAHWMPSSGFDHFLYDDALAGSRVLAWLLANPNYREPSIALVWRGLHYVLVRGLRCVGDPLQNPQLLGFYVADPDMTASFWLGADRFIPIDRWLNEMFTPVSYVTPHTGVPGDLWQNRIVAIQRSSVPGPTDNGQLNTTVDQFLSGDFKGAQPL